MQTIIALLESLDDSSWNAVTIEPDHDSDKVDILWEGHTWKKAVQVKSSINQIGKSDAENWATELKSEAIADKLELILVGPCAQSVAEMESFKGVSIPCPKTLDVEGLLGQAAHLLSKFLINESLDPKSPYQLEIMVRALTTELSVLSTDAKHLSRSALVELLKKWISSMTGPVTSTWEQVGFEHQRGIENAIAGKRLAPSDVEACPEFSICEEILAELKRSHLYQIVGTAGCGKSITGWQVAKNLHDSGYSVWRPRAFSQPEHLIADIPRAEPKLLIVDDAHQFGARFAEHISELSSRETKILLVSTVDNPLLSNIICIAPERCVDELRNAILNRRNEVLPIIQRYDNRIGDRYHDLSFEGRVDDCGRQKTPWEFFWVLRGGWQTARREFESLKQFSNASDLLAIIAIAQIVSCDAGVSYDWLHANARSVDIRDDSLKSALHHLDNLGLVIASDVIRTKHISYAHRVIEESFHHRNRDAWPKLIPVFLRSISEDRQSLKGICWLLGSVTRTNAFCWKSHGEFLPLVEPLIQRCVAELSQVSGCLSSEI